MDEPAVPPTNPPLQPAPQEPAPQPVTPSVQNAPSPLPIEETPELSPIVDAPQGASPISPSPIPSSPPPSSAKPVTSATKKSGSVLKTVGIILLFVVLFVAGVWLSSFVRQFLPGAGSSQNQKSTTVSTPTPSTVPTDLYATWKLYTVISGVTKTAVPGISFKLPPDVLAPICDGSSCVSQGTYLPGGTRFTVAARGLGQSLRDFRGSLITDAAGTPFTTTQTTIAGLPVIEYSGTFTGQTLSGYSFTQMHGFMIGVTNSVSLEVNHFTPNGVTADFAADDTLFTSIVNSFTFAGATPSATITPIVTLTPSASATASPTPTHASTATSSGY